MTALFTLRSRPRAILHIDGDAFFASCEQARNPAWRGRPVITGKERGIAASFSYEAKARGVQRAMPLFEIKKICPDAIIIPSDYELYSLLSQRFYAIVRRFTGNVEEYGIDECFADLTGLPGGTPAAYGRLAERLQQTLQAELGFSFSLGLAPSKVLAKAGSKWKKPAGLTIIAVSAIPYFLDRLPAAQVWGIGPSTTAWLEKQGLTTAGQFARQTEDWVRHNLSQPFWEIWQELRGCSVLPLRLEPKTSYASVQKTKTFTPPSNRPDFVFSQLAKNIENACIKLRRYNLAAEEAYIFLKTQNFNYYGAEVRFPRPTNVPIDMVGPVKALLPRLFSARRWYRATGVICLNLKPYVAQPDLFNGFAAAEKFGRVYQGADALAKKYGKHTVFLGASWPAHQFGAHLTERGDAPERQTTKLRGETKRRRLGVPMWLGKIT